MDMLSINIHSLLTSVTSFFDGTGSIWNKKIPQTYSFSACQSINVVAEKLNLLILHGLQK